MQENKQNMRIGYYCFRTRNNQYERNIKKAVAIDPAGGRIRIIIHGGRVNKDYNMCLFTRPPPPLLGK